MFFDVTRMGGRRTLRLRAEAIAWLEENEGVTAIHLIGGETIRVNEDRDEIERRCATAPGSNLTTSQTRRTKARPRCQKLPHQLQSLFSRSASAMVDSMPVDATSVHERLPDAAWSPCNSPVQCPGGAGARLCLNGTAPARAHGSG
jgi:uncharacterized protein YlzI (FlbEa/FlbD family)